MAGFEDLRGGGKVLSAGFEDLRVGGLEGNRVGSEKNEHRTPNAQHRILNGKKEEKGDWPGRKIARVFGIVFFSFDVGCSMFDVHL